MSKAGYEGCLKKLRTVGLGMEEVERVLEEVAIEEVEVEEGMEEEVATVVEEDLEVGTESEVVELEVVTTGVVLVVD